MQILTNMYLALLKKRYDISLVGEETLVHSGPFLLLPNHVALVDPQIVISLLSRYIHVSPVASEAYYTIPGIKQVMDIFGTIPIGDLTQSASPEAVKEAFSHILEALHNGKNVLIYPSGQIYRQGFEVIRGKQSTYQILLGMPQNTKVIGIRTRGLWGSMWSKAWDDGKTGIVSLFGKAFWYQCINLFFFIPKRKVSIELVDITKESLECAQEGLNQLNNYLENFYNRYGEEPLSYISHYFFYDDVKDKIPPKVIAGSLADLSTSTAFDISRVPEDVKHTIKTKIAVIKKIPVETITDTSNFVIDLYFDSLDLAEIKSYVQITYEHASNPPITDLKFISDVYAMALGESKTVELLKPCDWQGDFSGSETLYQTLYSRFFSGISVPYDPVKTGFSHGENILTLWKKEFSQGKNDTFLWDNVLGAQSKKDFTLKAYLIRDYIASIPGEYIGIMLPALGSNSLLVIATYLAGKTPVMLNWTLGKESFNHCVHFSKIEVILTASSFYEKVKQGFLEEYEKQGKFLFLETLLRDIPLFKKVKALVSSTLFLLPSQKEQAVLLFTSGSESLPKPVPLTHQNLIFDILGSLELVPLTKSEKILGFLPPFHSFGFTINTILPLITGVPCIYTPNPNDAKTILDIIAHTQATVMPTTPTFLKMILGLAKQENLASLRYVVSGAEKCGEEIFQSFEKIVPQACIIEGYGITECSPVVALNPSTHPKKGTVGKIISFLDCRILDVSTQKPVNVGEQGMIYVSGKTIFGGYLDTHLESPFESIEGKPYYKTGDLGFLDAEGYLTITGRLKRFIKIAGEMISLPFIESVLMEKYGSHDVVKIAIEALEKDGGAKIILFSIVPLVCDEVNAYLRERGVSNLIKIDEVRVIEAIPLLGTGKIDYKVLRALI